MEIGVDFPSCFRPIMGLPAEIELRFRDIDFIFGDI